MARYYRKVIRIRAEDSPNVRLGLAQKAAGETPTNEILVEGVLSYFEYVKRRKMWDDIRKCIGLDAQFYEGGEVLLFPPDWLNKAEEYATQLPDIRPTRKTLGVDSAQGGDNTSYCVADKYGVLHLHSHKTPHSSVIKGEVLMLKHRFGIAPEDIIFDAGGGGAQHAAYLQDAGYPVRTVAFGETVQPAPKHGMTTIPQKVEQRTERYIYKNRRAEMYGMAHLKFEPVNTGSDKQPKFESRFALPYDIGNRVTMGDRPSLRKQLSVIPKLYDSEGRLYLPPKNKRNKDDKQQTMISMVGCSPDEADALVLAIYALEKPAISTAVGAMW